MKKYPHDSDRGRLLLIGMLGALSGLVVGRLIVAVLNVVLELSK